MTVGFTFLKFQIFTPNVKLNIVTTHILFKHPFYPNDFDEAEIFSYLEFFS